LVVLFPLLVPLQAVAQQSPVPKIAILNVDKLMRDSLASKSIRDQLEGKRAAFQGDIAKREKALRVADQKMAEQRAVLSPDAFAERQKEFQKQVADTQRYVQNLKRQMDKGFADAMRKVEKVVAEVAEAVAKEKGMNIVLTRNMVVYAVPTLDITNPVLSRLDKKLPSVKVVISSK
jgi:Skp family chaperone for outer membrane proteins